jgi:hypothetical protein
LPISVNGAIWPFLGEVAEMGCCTLRWDNAVGGVDVQMAQSISSSAAVHTSPDLPLTHFYVELQRRCCRQRAVLRLSDFPIELLISIHPSVAGLSWCSRVCETCRRTTTSSEPPCSCGDVVIAGSMMALVQLLEQTDVRKDIGASNRVMLSHRHEDVSPPLQGIPFSCDPMQFDIECAMATASIEVDLPFMRLVTSCCSDCQWLRVCPYLSPA